MLFSRKRFSLQSEVQSVIRDHPPHRSNADKTSCAELLLQVFFSNTLICVVSCLQVTGFGSVFVLFLSDSECHLEICLKCKLRSDIS